MNTAVKIIRPAEEDFLIDVAKLAAERSMHLVTDGDEVMVCSVVPVGWRKMAVKFRPQWIASNSASGSRTDSEVLRRIIDGYFPLETDLEAQKADVCKPETCVLE